MNELVITVDILNYKDRPVAIIRLPCKFRMLSSTILGGGYTVTDTLFIFEVPLTYDGMDPVADLKQVIKDFDLSPDSIGFMTAADVKNVTTISRVRINDTEAVSVVTAGVTNALTAGERLSREISESLPAHKAGTINIISIVNRPLQDCGMANAIITMTEAKTAALKDAGIRGTGTTSDAVAIAVTEGDGDQYAGTATEVGIAIARSVRTAVAESIRKWSKNARNWDFMTRLDEIGVGKEELSSAVMSSDLLRSSLTSDVLRERFEKQLDLLRKDPNVNALVLAAMSVDEIGRAQETQRCGALSNIGAGLVADRLIGIALAEYIAGPPGTFEYSRFMERRPGVIATLGPFLDDIISGLIGGIVASISSDQQRRG